MEDHDWIKKPDEEKKDKKEEFSTEIQKVKGDKEETEAVETPEDGQKEELKAEISTVDESEPFDPFKDFSVIALVDIAPEVKKTRKVPQFFHIKKRDTTIGTGGRAHIKVDDLKTVKSEHGVIVFKNGGFHVYPLEGTVAVNGKKIFEKGRDLKNGSQIEMGSAKFIFLTVLNVENEDPTPP